MQSADSVGKCGTWMQAWDDYNLDSVQGQLDYAARQLVLDPNGSTIYSVYKPGRRMTKKSATTIQPASDEYLYFINVTVSLNNYNNVEKARRNSVKVPK